MAHGQLRDKTPQLERVLAGCVEPHQRFLVAEQVAHIDYLDAAITRVSVEISERVRPNEEALVAEIGTDVGRFPTAKHLGSWAGICQGNHERAGKRRGGATRKGSSWLRALGVQAAHCRSQDPRRLPGRTVLAAGIAAGKGAGHHRLRTHHRGHRLLPAE